MYVKLHPVWFSTAMEAGHATTGGFHTYIHPYNITDTIGSKLRKLHEAQSSCIHQQTPQNGIYYIVVCNQFPAH